MISLKKQLGNDIDRGGTNCAREQEEKEVRSRAMNRGTATWISVTGKVRKKGEGKLGNSVSIVAKVTNLSIGEHEIFVLGGAEPHGHDLLRLLT